MKRSTFITTALLGSILAIALNILEHALPVKPGFVWAEVVAGVVVTGIPVMVIARRYARVMTWKGYEQCVAWAFIGSGLPILVWQALLYGGVL